MTAQTQRAEFERYFKKWQELIKEPGLAISSVTNDYENNEPYKKMVNLGYAALPLFMEKLKKGYFFLNQGVSDITKLKPQDILPKGQKMPISEQGVSRLWLAWWAKNKKNYVHLVAHPT